MEQTKQSMPSKKKYMKVIDELYSTEVYKQKATEIVKSHFDYIRSFTKDLFTMFEEKVVLAQGELMSTAMVKSVFERDGCQVRTTSGS